MCPGAFFFFRTEQSSSKEHDSGKRFYQSSEGKENFL